MKLSIIVPIYNTKQYLNQCIESILGQTFQDFELILVDDGSTDGCGEICDEWEKKDKRIKVIHKANGGLYSAVAVGVDVSKGKYIGFVDSDDFVLDFFFERLMTLIEEEKVDLVCGGIKILVNCEIVELKGMEPGVYSRQEIKEKILDPFVFRDENLNWLYSRVNKLFRADMIKPIYTKHAVSSDMGEDLILNWRVLPLCDSLAIAKDGDGYMCRQHNASMTHCFKENAIAEQVKFADELLEVVVANNYPKECMDEYRDLLIATAMWQAVSSRSGMRGKLKVVRAANSELRDIAVPFRYFSKKHSIIRAGFWLIANRLVLAGTMLLHCAFWAVRRLRGN